MATIKSILLLYFVIFMVESGRAGGGKEVERSDVGTVLFNDKWKRCYSEDDILLLKYRKGFLSHVPKNMTKELMDEDSLSQTMQKFRDLRRKIEEIPDHEARKLAYLALFDVFGNFWRSYLIPVVKMSFYAGNLQCKEVHTLISLYELAKNRLGTAGLGWERPLKDFKDFTFKVEPLPIQERGGTSEDSCESLILLDDDIAEGETLIPLPRLEPDDDQTIFSIWLPFRRKHVFNVHSRGSAFILLKYFVAATKCHLASKLSPDTFNQQLRNWIKSSALPHLKDEKFYTAFGAILRILKTVNQNSTAQMALPALNGGEVLKMSDLNRRNPEFTVPLRGEKRTSSISSDWSFIDEKLNEQTPQHDEGNIVEAYFKSWFFKVSAIAILICFILMLFVVWLRKFLRNRNKLKSESNSKSHSSGHSRSFGHSQNSSQLQDRIGRIFQSTPDVEEIRLTKESSSIMSDNVGRRYRMHPDETSDATSSIMINEKKKPSKSRSCFSRKKSPAKTASKKSDVFRISDETDSEEEFEVFSQTSLQERRNVEGFSLTPVGSIPARRTPNEIDISMRTGSRKSPSFKTPSTSLKSSLKVKTNGSLQSSLAKKSLTIEKPSTSRSLAETSRRSPRSRSEDSRSTSKDAAGGVVETSGGWETAAE